ncbi:hypothetical protein LAJ19_06810 [Deinococcus taeanensis]|uniref:hypothetical protein n=1 Tax=Deinococcus taeanensis TaxID=2737050 RepID=UPI001CDBFC57|nr:hypothetical protein [Deinococcus taeanensis]UBV43917.1 hypothetical protein LAJ19_06810 [Deinococcus taeanensis]
MTPEEWQRGMRNEAANVTDQQWIMETHWAAGRFNGRQSLRAAVAFALLGSALVLLNAFSWQQERPAQLWLGVMTVTGVVGTLLGARRVGALEAGAGALAFLPGAWLTVVALQAIFGHHAPASPGFENEAVTTLAVIAAGAASVVRSLRPPALPA